MSQNNFNPKILGFLCNWCCYAAADAAGVSRYQYPPNLRTIRVMCTGRVDPEFILRGFVEGAAGIFTGGWQLGECHYQVGNYDAMGMLALVRKVLVKIGIKEERFSLQWASAAEAPRFVRLITDFTQQIKELGPLGEAEGIEPDELKKRLALGLAAVSDRKLRMSFGTATRTIRKEADITQKYIDSVIEDKLTKPFTKVFEPKSETEKKPAAAKKPATPKKSAVAKKATPSKKKTSAAKKKTATKKKK